MYLVLVELGEPPTLLLAVSSGRNHVTKVTIRLASSGVTFRLEDVYLHEGKEVSRGAIIWSN
jgi:hypothetical protein